MDGLDAAIGSVTPFTGDVAPQGWEFADGTPVTTPWSPLYGELKPDLTTGKPGVHAPGFAHYGQPRQGTSSIRYIIKVAMDVSTLDGFTRAVFTEEEVPYE